MRRPLSPTFPGRPAAAALRLSLTAAALQLLAACASAPPPAVTAPVVVAAPSPGWGAATPSDPWGPYIAEASARFDVPEAWIRTVMQIESGGRTTLNGRPITSSAGAQGLMQVMPATFEALRRKHGLGPDPYDPFTNIMAGTAYIREMYDIYGAPGFLAAYNCGPGCYGDYLAGARTLPAETRRYLAMGTPGVQGHLPRVQTAGGDIGLPTTVIAAAPRPAAPPPLPAPARPAPARPVAVAMTAAPAKPAAAPAGGSWGVQVGAFSSEAASAAAAERARKIAPAALGGTRMEVVSVSTSGGTLFRARLMGVSQEQASAACQQLVTRGAACVRVAG